MNHAVIVAHPSPDSFNLSMAHSYCDVVESLGHHTIMRDLYRMGFNPALGASEIPHTFGLKPDADVAAELRMLRSADVFVLVYPLWFSMPPAIMKGYIDRVFSAGFGVGPAGASASPALTGKHLLSITTSGAPATWPEEQRALDNLQAVLDYPLAAACGLNVLGHIHFGDVSASPYCQKTDSYLWTLRKSVIDLFSDAEVELRKAL